MQIPGQLSAQINTELTKLIDWMPIDRSLEVIFCATSKGERAWPPLSLFKAMLLSIWYVLSEGAHCARTGQDPADTIISHLKAKAIRVKTDTLVDDHRLGQRG